MAKSRRFYNIIFEERNIEIIREDYFKGEWISKEELQRLIEYEEKNFVAAYQALQNDYRDLLSSFNMNSLANYELLERKFQGKLK